MEYTLRGFRIFIEEDYASLSATAAEILADELILVPNGVFGFATGGTPIGMYEALVKKYKAGLIDFSGITTFNLDEYFPIKRDNSQSYFWYMNENLFKHVNIKPENINLPNGEAEDGITESKRYGDKIACSGGIDLQILGIGNNGHIGFNEPDESFAGDTHLTGLKESTIEANARFFENPADVPRAAITMGVREIMSAKKILLIATGSGKAKIICDALTGSITPAVPASALQFHQNVIVVLDSAASTEIKDKLRGI